MRSLCRVTSDLLITGVLSSSVVIASDQCLERRGFNYHLELNFFLSPSLNKYHSIYYDDKTQKKLETTVIQIFFGGGGGGESRETRGLMVYGKMVNIYGFTSLPCNLLHSIFETRLHSPLHK